MPRKKRETLILTLDTETYGFDGDLKRIAVYDGYKVQYGYTFEDIEPVLDNYFNMGFDVHVYIHNMEFDARKMPKILCKENTNWNNTIRINGRFSKIACNRYTFHDSWRLLPSSLKDLSKDFDVEHGKLDLMDAVNEAYPGEYKDEGDYFKRCDKDDPVYVKYLGYDVMSLYEVIQKLMELSGLTPSELVGRLSTASISKYLFKNGYKGHKFMTDDKESYEVLSSMYAWNSTKPIKNHFSDEEISYLGIENKIREAYFGGRTEVFIPHLEPKTDVSLRCTVKNPFPEPTEMFHVKQVVGWHYDVNSLYPSVMIDNLFPVGFPQFTDRPKLAKMWFNEWLEYHEGLGYIKAKVHVPQQDIPPLPVHMGKLVFPCGYIEGTWGYHELEYAIKNCGVTVIEYQECIHFKKTAKVFKDFVETFYQMKELGAKTKNKSLKAFAKLILNTAYGWTVLNRDDKDELHNYDTREKYEDRIIFENEELGYINIKSYVDADSIQPQIGAYVTVYARIALLEGMRRQLRIGKVYYCDTDSIVTDVPMAKEFVHGSHIGMWDCEGELYEGLFLQPKVYYEDKADIVKKWVLNEQFTAILREQTIKFKGVSKKTQEDFNKKFYQGLYDRLKQGSKEKVTVEKDKWLLRSLTFLQKNNLDGNYIEYRDKTMNLAGKQKRNMDYEGNTSQAWYMESLEMFHSFDFSTPVIPWSEQGNIMNPCA